jgi:hypothetical protein
MVSIPDKIMAVGTILFRGEIEMRIPDNLAMILLALYLIIAGVNHLGPSPIGIILGLLALGAGILLLLQHVRR